MEFSMAKAQKVVEKEVIEVAEKEIDPRGLIVFHEDDESVTYINAAEIKLCVSKQLQGGELESELDAFSIAKVSK